MATHISCAQKADTTYYRDRHIQTITKRKDSLDRLTNISTKIWEIHSFYDDGKVLSNALCVFRNSSLSPIKETSIFFEDGQPKEYCNPDKGELKKYNSKGKLIYSLIEKPGDTVQTETEYYYNGNIKKIRKEKKVKNILLVNYYSATQNLPEMHQTSHYGFISEKDYYPNGKIFSESGNRKVNGIETMSTIYYTEDGKKDTSSTVAANFNG